jgi:ribokinase
MPDVVIVGSVALDNVRTPFGKAENALGGSATYASVAASYFAKPGIVAVVGNDFPKKHIELLKKKKVDIAGLEFASGKTFRWEGYYEFDLNQAHTVNTELNVFSDFNPVLPEKYRNAKYLFLGNISPSLQLSVLDQMKKRPKLVVSDTMNYYIGKDPEAVKQVIKKVDIGLMNEGEARQLFKTPNLITAARQIISLDSEYAIIKKGVHGAIMLSKKGFFAAPGYPLENVVDPTGSGDSFAGAFIGYLAKTGNLSEKNFRKAIIYASTIASFNAEDFSLGKLANLSRKEIEARVRKFRELVRF